MTEAEKYSYNKNNRDYNVWISVVGEEERKKINRMRNNFTEKNVKFFHQYFADWSDEDGETWKHLEASAPQKKHVQNIVSFLRTYTDTETPYHLGVNCFAGISRSTAVGIIALVMSGRTPAQALTELLKQRPEAWPNLRILRFGGEILEVDLYTPVVEWKQDVTTAREVFIMPDRKQKEQQDASPPV